MLSVKNNEYQYDSKKPLGGGAFAKVYTCIRTVDNAKMAIKVIRKETFLKNNGKDLRKYFDREIAIQQIATKSKIPFYVGLLDFFEDGDNIYLVMELCEKNLLEYVGEKVLQEDVALEFAFQIGLGLNYLHNCQISHRDIKMENIMIKQGVLKIADFGFASQSQIMLTNLGTPTFMAPEFYDEKIRVFSPKVDVWALNTCLYFLLTGKLYFFSIDPLRLRKQILKEEFVINQDTQRLKPETKDLLTKAYMKKEEERLSMQQFIDHPVFNFLRPKYAQFLGKQQLNQADLSVDNLRVSDVMGDNQVYRDYLMNFRNNTLLYLKLARMLKGKNFNIILVFLLVKRAAQNLTALFICLKTRAVPQFRNFAKINIDNKEWGQFVGGHWSKALSSVSMSDQVMISRVYRRACLDMINNVGDFDDLPSFDLNVDHTKMIVYMLNEMLSKLDECARPSMPDEFKPIIKIGQRLLIFENYSPEQMVNYYVPM